MANARYVNALVQNTPISLGTPAVQYGVLLSEYQVQEYRDLRTTSDGTTSTPLSMRAYIVTLKQRLSLSNPNANSFGAMGPVTEFDSYPILAVQMVTPETEVPSLDYYLEDYSPKTLNAAVNTTQNAGTTSTTSSGVQRTSGSSTSDTNSYGLSASLGFFGEDATGSIEGSYGRSNTTGTDQSRTSSRGQDRGLQSGSGSSMSIKDWASYAFLDFNRQQPSWVWGQEYPWNVIDFRNQLTADPNTPNQSTYIQLPGYVQTLLYDGQTVFPPSYMAQFGLDFVASARWVFYLDGQAGSADEVVSFSHGLTYWVGSHTGAGGLGNPVVTATLALITPPNFNIETLVLNLPVLSLNPITRRGAGNGAVIGFVQSEFITPPGDPNTWFRLKSGATNLYVTQGAGFDALTNDDSVLTASGVTSSSPASMTIQFKLVDESLELNLYFKHWITSSASCAMTLVINGQTITRHIDAMDAGSGADNITTVTLRSRDYTGPDYYDYLVMGVNTITVTYTPGDGQASCGYALRALAIQ